MRAPAKKSKAAPAPASEPRRRRQEKPDLARCDVRTRPVAPSPSEAPHPVPGLPDDWEPPVLRAGGTWIGGSLRREDIYDDDGR
jgi:hypothetical protein